MIEGNLCWICVLLLLLAIGGFTILKVIENKTKTNNEEDCGCSK